MFVAQRRSVDHDIRRIRQLIGDLMEAKWRRFTQSDDAVEAVRSEREYVPSSDEEKTIWGELAAPENYEALCRYIAQYGEAEVTEYAAALHTSMLAEAGARLPED